MAETAPANEFSGSLSTVAWLLALPTGTMTLGGALVFFYSLGPKQIAGLQHFASGILLAAIGWELAPSIKAESNIDKGAIIIGFLIGAAFLMFVGRYDFKHWQRCYGGISEEESSLISDKEEDHGKGQAAEDGQKDGYPISLGDQDSGGGGEKVQAREVPTGLIIAVMLDGSIDGLLIGVAYVASGSAGLITAIALGLEMCLLGISTVTTLNKTRLARWKTVTLVIVLPWAIMGAGMLGATVLSGLTGSWYIAVISFGAAGLLYLVTEELMIEAHEDEETDRWYVSGLFFLGFLFVVVLSEYVPSDL